MVEKKQVLYDLRTTYNGPFLVEDFYAEVDNWISEEGFEKEHKSKKEHVTKNGKRIEWVTEVHKQLSEFHHAVIVLRAWLDNIKDTTIKKDGKKSVISHGEASITIDAFVQSYVHSGFWQTKPVYYFIRTLIDKFAYAFWTDRYDGAVNSSARDLFKRIRSFFELQRYKYDE